MPGVWYAGLRIVLRPPWLLRDGRTTIGCEAVIDRADATMLVTANRNF
jgi:hypothetical protein